MKKRKKTGTKPPRGCVSKRKKTVAKPPRGCVSKRKKTVAKLPKGFIKAPSLEEMNEALRRHERNKQGVFPKDPEEVLETARGMFPDLDIRLK